MIPWQSIALVGLGGGIGAIMRYLTSEAMRSASQSFPVGTLLVNLLGSFVLGMWVGYELRHSQTEGLRLLLAVGVCGGFTTFSTFAIEALRLIQHGATWTAVGYILASVLGGLACAYIGMLCFSSPR